MLVVLFGSHCSLAAIGEHVQEAGSRVPTEAANSPSQKRRRDANPAVRVSGPEASDGLTWRFMGVLQGVISRGTRLITHVRTYRPTYNYP